MDSNQEIQLEVDILNEELNLEQDDEVDKIWPENYETYIGDGLYEQSVN